MISIVFGIDGFGCSCEAVRYGYEYVDLYWYWYSCIALILS